LSNTGEAEQPVAAVAAVAVIEPESPAPPVPEPVVAVSVGIDLASVTELWPAVVESAQAENRLVGAVLAHARPTALEGGELTLALVGKTNKALAEDPVKRELIARAVRTVTGSSLRLAYELRAEAARDDSDAPGLSADEMIQRLMTEFEAEELPPELESGPGSESEPEEAN
jgi:DNA polymerase-3 subunit gamma/tau